MTAVDTMTDRAAQVDRLASWIGSSGSTLLDDPGNNIIGIGIGKKSGGAFDDDSDMCVTAFVEKKLSVRELETKNFTEFSKAFASASNVSNASDLGIELDVVETGTVFAPYPGLSISAPRRGVYGGPPPSIDLQKRFESLRSGIGITNPHGSFPDFLNVGTLGFFVATDDGKTYLVSNNHVIANENSGTIGDSVVQPGTLDLTNTELSVFGSIADLTAELQIASLAGWVDIEFHGPGGIPFNEVDCAVAELLDDQRDLDNLHRVGFGGSLLDVALPYSLDPVTGGINGSTKVYKAGRTTGWTEGNVTNLNVMSDVAYDAGAARFVNQIAIQPSRDNVGPFSDSGDSGSGIINENHELVGLLFAGSQSRTLMNPIEPVITQLSSVLNSGSLSVVCAAM